MAFPGPPLEYTFTVTKTGLLTLYDRTTGATCAAAWLEHGFVAAIDGMTVAVTETDQRRYSGACDPSEECHENRSGARAVCDRWRA